MSSNAVSSSVPQQSETGGWGRFALVGLATIVVAVLANVVVYFIASGFVTYDSRFLPLVSVGGAIIFTVVPAVVAVLLYAVLRRMATNPARVFTIIAAVAFVVTLIPDFLYAPTVPGATASQIAVLVVMHVAAAGVIVGMLTRLARSALR